MKNYSEGIHKPHGRALGDCWSVINYFISLGLEKDEISRLSLWYYKGESIKRVDKLKDVLAVFKENDMVELDEWEATVEKIHWTKGYEYSSRPTKIIWKPNNYNRICYQFDGRYRGGASNFPSKEIENEVLIHAINEGYDIVRLGAEKTLDECIKVASECNFFLGIDSGMAYLVASVGTPILFCRNERPLALWTTTNHSNKHFILSDDYVELKENITRFKDVGLQHYIHNATNIDIFMERNND